MKTLSQLCGGHGFIRSMGAHGPREGPLTPLGEQEFLKETVCPPKDTDRTLLHSFNIYLLSTYYVPGIVPDTRYIVINKSSKVSCANRLGVVSMYIDRFFLRIISNRDKNYEENKTDNDIN